MSYFHSSSYFTGLLRNEQKVCYNQTITLITPGETRWNSYYFCFNSILRTEAALKVSDLIIGNNCKLLNITGLDLTDNHKV